MHTLEWKLIATTLNQGEMPFHYPLTTTLSTRVVVACTCAYLKLLIRDLFSFLAFLRAEIEDINWNPHLSQIDQTNDVVVVVVDVWHA